MVSQNKIKLIQNKIPAILAVIPGVTIPEKKSHSFFDLSFNETKINDYVRISELENQYVLKVHICLFLENINYFETCREIQIRLKNELETPFFESNKELKVNVYIDEIIKK